MENEMQSGLGNEFAVRTEPAPLPVGEEQLRKAIDTLQRYKNGKQSLEQRIVENEEWWKLRHWQSIRKGNPGDPKPASGWLVNVCLSKHADAMDSIPEPNILPREPQDQEEARRLTSIVPVILQQNGYENTYSDCWWYKIKHGASCKGIFWDAGKLGGLGDVAIRKVDLLNLFWEPGVTDIQKSRNVFHVELRDNDLIEAEWPQTKDKLGTALFRPEKYLYDDNVDTSGKSVIIDWYYKKREGTKDVLCYAKFVGDILLYASENEDAQRAGEREGSGWYDHGKYPFVIDVLFPEEGTPAGYGYIDLCKDSQEYIDRLDSAILKNALVSATPRWFARTDGAINEEEFADWTKPFVHVNGNLGQDSILLIQPPQIPSTAISARDEKIEEMKQISGNRDVSNGGTTAGVTAASAIAAMQEQSGKLSRDQIAQSYRAYREEVLMVIELIRQFYDLPRQFRIIGEKGRQDFITYSNAGLRPQAQGIDAGVDMGLRAPVFDIEVNAQKQNAYSKMSQNELALQLYGAGFFNPAAATPALAALEIMDFKGKEEVTQIVANNGGLLQQLQQTRLQLLGAFEAMDKLTGGNMAERYARENLGTEPGGAAPAKASDKQQPTVDNTGALKEPEHAFVQKAREQTRNSTAPR